MELGTFAASLLLVVFLLAIPALLFLYSNPLPWRKKKMEQKDPSAPNYTFKPYPLVGCLPQFLKHRHRLHDWQTDVLAASPTGTIALRRLGNVPGIITANPANVEHIIKANYRKAPRFVSITEDLLGRGIFNSEGEQWRAQRKTASFEFNSRSFRKFVVESVTQEMKGRLLPLLRRAAARGVVVDLQDALERFGFDVMCKVAFNEDPKCLADSTAAWEEGGDEASGLPAGFALAFRDASSLTAARFRYAIPGMWKVKKLLNVGSERRLKESISTVHDFATRIIRSRKKEKEKSPSFVLQHQDLLSRFIAGENNSDEHLRDIVINFILAGIETTSSALSWFFWLLSSRPEVERRILDELRTLRAARRGNNPDTIGDGEEDKEKALGFEELGELHYLHAAISESMRLYPPIPVNAMASRADEVLPDGTFVGKGWFLSYSSYAMGRMPAVWGKDCREYRPERWLDEGGAFRPESPFRYPVFHGGARLCLGKEMAYIQMKSIAASVLEQFVVEVAEGGRSPEQMVSVTLRMKGGLPVRVRERLAP